ncbi:MAG: hypothetical protein ABWX84_03235 [Nocardioides sp.]
MRSSPAYERPDVTAYRLLWRAAVATTVLLTGIVTLLTLGVVRSAVAVTLMMGMGALYGFLLGPSLPQARHPVLTGAAISGGATLVVVGAPGATHGMGLVLLAALVGTSPTLVGRLTARLSARVSAPVSAPVGLDGFDVLVRAWDDDELTMAWYQSEAALHEAATVEELARLAVVRQLYLDELERRSPESFPRWLAAQSLDH